MDIRDHGRCLELSHVSVKSAKNKSETRPGFSGRVFFVEICSEELCLSPFAQLEHPTMRGFCAMRRL